MFAIIGIVVVFGAVIAGYLMEHGNMGVLMQPAELIIILGAVMERSWLPIRCTSLGLCCVRIPAAYLRVAAAKPSQPDLPFLPGGSPRREPYGSASRLRQHQSFGANN
jgi:hypothetical protein